MRLDGASPAAGKILQLAPCGIKGIPDRHVDILVGLTLDHQLPAGQGEINPDIIEQPFMLMPMRRIEK